MIRAGAILAVLLALAACHRGGAGDVTLDGDEDARNATAARTLSDLAAAEDAARGPLPAAPAHHARASVATSAAAPADDAVDDAEAATRADSANAH